MKGFNTRRLSNEEVRGSSPFKKNILVWSNGKTSDFDSEDCWFESNHQCYVCIGPVVWTPGTVQQETEVRFLYTPLAFIVKHHWGRTSIEKIRFKT